MTDEYLADDDLLFETISTIWNKELSLSEGDAEWRRHVISNSPSIFSMRRTDDGYRFLNLKFGNLAFTSVKLNREAVRGMWAGQQHELIFLGNQNSERGSIQSMRSTLRNLIMQSCDLPVGYPIYISPLVTTFW
eukprot:c14014_g1_i1.p1 GENE.c14014_g1_i1~~c14014_g1_i1.p1  ORF type:complete len:155 (+),score=28.56 c14014_g1_i1:66-467(+)